MSQSTASAQAESFTSFAGFSVDGAEFAGIGSYQELPPAWYQGETLSPFPGWDANMIWDWEGQFTAEFAPNEAAFGGFAAPFSSSSVVSARDQEGNVIGTLTLDGVGVFEVDSSIDRAIVDEVSSQIFVPYRLTEDYTVSAQTGSFANLKQIGPWSLEGFGRSVRPILPGQDFATAANNPPLSGSATLYIAGEFEIVPEPAALGISFIGIVALLCVRQRRRTAGSGLS